MNSATYFDVERARSDTPGAFEKLHFNNAGASLMPKPVIDAVISHLQLEGRIGGYEAADQAQSLAERSYSALATLLNCKPNEIAIVENATRAWDMAFYSMRFQPGDRIITAVSEYASNYIAFLQMKNLSGVQISVIPNDQSGQLDAAALKNMIDDKVKLIAITHVPTNGGLVNPAAEVGAIARAANIPYLLDACQSVGQIEMDVESIGCDMLTATGRKFLRAPRGTGFLYVRSRILDKLEPPFLDLHAADWVSRDKFVMRQDARRFENWESYFAGKIGLGVAVDYALSWGLTNIEARVAQLADVLRQKLSEIPGITVRDLGRKKCAIVTFSSDRISAPEIQRRLSEKNINVSISRLIYSRLDMEDRGLNELVRASVHYYNTIDEIDRFCAELQMILDAL